jgi:hypothetical protein
MNGFHAVCRCFAICAASVMLAACQGSRASVGGLPNVVPGAQRGANVSWMAPEAANEDLLYLSDTAANDVKVYSFPQDKLVGTLTGFGKPRSECADAAGDVWIADVEGRDVIEYPHGGTKPIASLSFFGVPQACSADSATRYLAVAGGISGAIVSIYHKGAHGRWSDPQRYGDSALGVAYFCGYDSNGDLFIDGLTKSKRGRFALVELPRRSQTFETIAVSQAIKAPGQVQWDGKHLAVGDSGVAPSLVYEFSISGSNATEVGSTPLDGTTSVRQFWIASGTLVGPDFDSSVGLWKYPKGGSPIKTIADVHGYGAAVSLAERSR